MRLDGVLFFPVTPFRLDGTLDESALRRHVEQGVNAGAGGVFAACGTGEFHALNLDEYERVVRVAVEATAGRVPVFAGTGGALPFALSCARAAEQAGADGLLMLPPYLVTGSVAGLTKYFREIAAASPLPSIVYQRGTRLTPEAVVELAALPNVIGLKDGIGDLDLLQKIIIAVRRAHGPEFMFLNGLPTAEMTQLAYRGIGVRLYSSAVFGFLPEVALAFYKAVESGDEELIQRLLADFYHPLVELRDLVPGYAVSLIKAGVTVRGVSAGSVRLPLLDADPEHIAQLRKLINRGLEIAGC